ncbi:MAG: hypothetical protein ACPGSB_11305 [Opitutales bacterium]
MKNKDMLLTLGGIALMALLIFAVRQSRQPEPVVLDLKNKPEMSEEHSFVRDALLDADVLARAEDSSLSRIEQDSPADDVLPVAGAPLARNWESKPAPEADAVELSPALQRSLAASAHLRTDDYINPNSEYNLEAARALQEARKSRHEVSE